jgi:hypothetical protein
MDLPPIVTRGLLFAKLREDDELFGAITSLRACVEALAATTSRTVPDFTDHTVRHMDALWGVADVVLTEREIAGLSTAEPPPAKDEISVLINGKGQLTPNYRPTDQGKNVGSLSRIWKECASSPLFATLVGIVAQAWQVSPEQLMEQGGWIHERDDIRGRFHRP